VWADEHTRKDRRGTVEQDKVYCFMVGIVGALLSGFLMGLIGHTAVTGWGTGGVSGWPL